MVQPILPTKATPACELSAVHLNVRSVRALTKFDRVVSQFCPRYDLIILSETWLRQEESVFYNIDGYDRFACCREARGGGLLVFIKNSLVINSVVYAPLCTAESISVELGCSGGSLWVTAIYRAPNLSGKAFIKSSKNY